MVSSLWKFKTKCTALGVKTTGELQVRSKLSTEQLVLPNVLSCVLSFYFLRTTGLNAVEAIKYLVWTNFSRIRRVYGFLEDWATDLKQNEKTPQQAVPWASRKLSNPLNASIPAVRTKKKHAVGKKLDRSRPVRRFLSRLMGRRRGRIVMLRWGRFGDFWAPKKTCISRLAWTAVHRVREKDL